MPALPPVPGTVRTDIHFLIGAANALFRTHFSYSGGAPTAANCATLATALRTAWTANMAQHLYTGSVMTGTQVTDLASTSGAFGVDTTNVNGTEAGSALPAGTAYLINFKIARKYRGGKPRCYLPLGVAADLATRANWLSTNITNTTTHFTAFIAGFVGQVAGTTTISGHVNVSYYSGFTNVAYGSPTKYRRVPTLRATPLVDAITSYAVQPSPASQRRRNLA